MTRTRSVNIAIVGATGVGKTSSWTMWTNRVVIEKYECTVSESPHRLVTVDRQQYSCGLAEMGRTEFSAMTNLFYEKADAFLVLFSVTDLESFTQAEELIGDIIKVRKTAKDEGKNIPEPCFMLWGTKTDTEEERKVSKEQGEELAKQYGMPYMEGSTRVYEETDPIFMALVHQFAAPLQQPAKRRRCVIM